MFCSVCGAESKTDAEQRAHINTTRHLIAARKMWQTLLEHHPARNAKQVTRAVKEAQVALAEIDRRLALLAKKEG